MAFPCIQCSRPAGRVCVEKVTNVQKTWEGETWAAVRRFAEVEQLVWDRVVSCGTQGLSNNWSQTGVRFSGLARVQLKPIRKQKEKVYLQTNSQITLHTNCFKKKSLKIGDF